MSEEHPFLVDMRALVDQLGSHLYSDPLVVVREMLANCRDALVRARRDFPEVAARIDVTFDFGKQSVTFTDNGSGMTRDEVVRGLSTLAGSYTRLLRAKKDEYLSPADVGFTGRFGLGFFSSLMVSQAVDVLTSPQEGGPGLLWRCGPETFQRSSYVLEETPSAPRGTAVTLFLRQEFVGDLLDHARLAELICRYGDFIEFPIYLTGTWVNRMFAPWEPVPRDLPEALALEKAREYLLRRGLATNETLVWHFRAGSGRQYRALLYVVHPADANGGVELYAQRMFVRTSQDLLGEHLSFFRGVALCDDLPLTLAREDVVQSPGLEMLKKALRADALAALRGLCTDPGAQGTLARVTGAYGRELKIGCLHDVAMLQILGDHVQLRTLSGTNRPLGSTAGPAGRTAAIYFVDDAETQAPAGALFEAKGFPVFDASDRLDWAVLNSYASATSRPAKRADTALLDLVKPTTDPGFFALELLFAEADPDVDPKVVEFAGGCPVPALVVREQASPLLEMLERARRAGADMGSASPLLEEIRGTRGGDRKAVLLNAAHPLVLLFRDSCRAKDAREGLLAAARALIASAVAYSCHLDSHARVEAYERQTEAYEALLRLLAPRRTDTPSEANAHG